MFVVCAGAMLLFTCDVALAGRAFDGQMDFDSSPAGNYAVITGGLFPNGQTYNGNNASGGTIRFIHDDASLGYPGAFQTWERDDWFTETSSVALTMKNDGSIIFDNNGIETSSYPTNFYGNPSDPSQITPGLYCGYSMSNVEDWIWGGYFRVNEATEFDTIIGYFPETYYDPIDLSYPWEFDVNIFSAVDGIGDDAGYLMPANTGAFRGDVFSSDTTPGTFYVSNTGEVRHYSGFSDNDDIIYRLLYELDEPFTLPAGEYFFSHDAQAIPEPVSLVFFATGLAGVFGFVARRRMQRRRT
jgi:hypothetical protein